MNDIQKANNTPMGCTVSETPSPVAARGVPDKIFFRADALRIENKHWYITLNDLLAIDIWLKV